MTADPDDQISKLRKSALEARAMAAKSPFKADRDRFTRLAAEYELRADRCDKP